MTSSEASVAVTRPQTTWRLPYILLALATAAYAVLTLTTPTDTAHTQYGLTSLQTRLLQFTIVAPVIVVWWMALWGSLQFKEYALKIYASSDGEALNRVANGLICLVAGLVTMSVVQTAIARFTDETARQVATVVSNYTAILFPLVAFAIILSGARRLAALVDFKGVRKAQLLGLVALAAMGICYVAVLLGSGTHMAPGVAPYYLSSTMVIATIVVPYLIVWYVGILAAIHIQSYQCYSPGIIYRDALRNLSRGLYAILGASLLIQLITANSEGLKGMGLQAIILLLYGLIMVYALGHVLVVLGARSLRKIEEVQ